MLNKFINLFRKKNTQSVSEFLETGTYSQEENDMPTYQGDGKECPFCKSAEIRKIAYGYIRFNSDDDKSHFLKEHTLGGCAIEPTSPKYYCNTCKKRFGKMDMQ